MRINKVFFAGRLARDPDLHQTSTGTAVCNITLVQNSRTKDENGSWVDGDPIYVDAAIWGMRGEAFSKHHKKGQMAFVEGRLRYDVWLDKESGLKRSKLKLDADNWEFVPRETEKEAPF